MFGSEPLHFIIFDLEWNCIPVKDGEKQTYLNEIIEIGAVRLDESLAETARFSEFVRPSVKTKLNKYVKNLTHIKESDLESAGGFEEVFSKFERFCEGDDAVFMTWSNTDLHVLAENLKKHKDEEGVGFIKKYADLQRYVMQFLKHSGSNQISLANAAAALGISEDGLSLHRACDDSCLCGKLFRKTYEKPRFDPFVHTLDKTFCERLMYHAHYVSDQNDPAFDKNDLFVDCPSCKKPLFKTGKLRFYNNTFTQKYICKSCGKRYKLFLKIKKTYDDTVKNVKLRESVKKGDKNGSKS